jgi:hypothetical protein
MAGSIEETGIHVGAIVAGSAYLSLAWWNSNSAGIVAIAAAIGAACSLVGLIFSWIRKR